MKVTITFDIPDNQLDYTTTTGITYTDPCINCPNNPAVNPNASGICSCALPSMCNPIY